MKKLYYLIVLVLILGLVLTGCSLLSNVGQVPATEQSGIPYLPKGMPFPIAANLVALWHFDENSGTTAYDSTENYNDGTIYGAPSWVDGKLGKALSFDGNDYVMVPDSSLLEPDRITVEAWVKSSGTPGSYKYIVSKYLPTKPGSYSSYGLYTANSGGLRFYIGLSSIGVLSPDAGPGVWDGNWHHVAGTYDGSAVKLYVDGEQVTGTGSTTSDIHYEGTGNLFIGAYTTASLCFSGTIDEVRIWDGALTADEILYSYADETLHVDDDWAQWPGAYYTINEALAVAGDGDTIIVHEGTYSEKLTINKSITLQAGSMPTIDLSGFTGDGIKVTANNVTIDGFEIIGIQYLGSGSSNVNPTIAAEANYVTVQNCVFNTSGGALGKEAMVARPGTNNISFLNNEVNNYMFGITARGSSWGGSATLPDDGVTDMIVSGNTFNVGYVDDGSQITGEAVQIHYGDNIVVTDNTINGPGKFETCPYSLINSIGIVDFMSGYGAAGTVNYSNNVVTNCYVGIGTFAGNGQISGNTVTGNNIGIQVGQNDAVYISTPAEGVAITCNYIENNIRGIWAQNFVPDGLAAHFNNIVGNTEYGVINEDPEDDVFDATCNWWGADNGPGAVGPGSGDAVSLNVDYNPWLTEGASLVYTGTPQPLTLVVLEATLSDSTPTGISGVDVQFWLDGDSVGTAITDSNGVARCDITYLGLEVGVYEVYATAACDLTSATEYLAVYDPFAGFVTGGGWINSPAGASADYPDAVGKATFGFVSKYKKGAAVPTGNTEFQFKAGDLNFHSDSYDWLVIAGDKAKYKGTGTINGTGDYGFMLTATDSNPDLFRIKIQDKIDDKVIYDNKMDSDDTGYDGTELGGGQIIVHKGK